MKSAVSDYIKGCLPCARNSLPTRSTLSSVLNRPALSDLISIDYVGPIHQVYPHYYLCILDHATRFIVNTVTTSPTTAHAIKSLKESWIPIFGAPKAILTDRGTHFTSTDFKKYVTRTLAAHHVMTSPYYPQGNSINEKSHVVLNKSIKISLQFVNHDHRLIPQAILDATLSYNATYHSSLGDSPFFRLFGRDPILPGYQDFT